MSKNRGVYASLSPDLDAALDRYCFAHGISRAAVARMAIEAMLFHVDSPWWAGYAEGFSSAQGDVQPALEQLLSALKDASQAAKDFGATIRSQTIRARL